MDRQPAQWGQARSILPKQRVTDIGGATTSRPRTRGRDGFIGLQDAILDLQLQLQLQLQPQLQPQLQLQPQQVAFDHRRLHGGDAATLDLRVRQHQFQRVHRLSWHSGFHSVQAQRIGGDHLVIACGVNVHAVGMMTARHRDVAVQRSARGERSRHSADAEPAYVTASRAIACVAWHGYSCGVERVQAGW
ncbi:hypothetical protein ASF90_17715 [Xanthomonas sp. Leaf148]|nr:hypothetical protein ASF90_17715 [Xanthomonas sp. Leaf148]